MLINFGIKNMTSFKDEAILSLSAYNRLSRHKEAVCERNGKSFLKTIIIYGPNASGKSNLLQSLALLINLIVGRANPEPQNHRMIYYPFLLSTQTEKKPVEFFIEFVLEDKFFRYEISLDDKEIFFEQLKQQIKAKEEILFLRKKSNLEIINEKIFLEGIKIRQLDVLNKAIPVLSLSSYLNGEISKSILSFFKKMRMSLMPCFLYTSDMDARIKDNAYRMRIEKFLQAADLSISSLSYREIPEGESKRISPRFEHCVYDEEHKLVRKRLFASFRESRGTLGYLKLLPLILDVLEKGGVFLADELEASLHPLLVEQIIKLFNSEHNKRAQLIFTSHNTTFLTKRLFRKDQIYFVEKNPYGESHLFSLLDYIQNAREDENWETRYLGGMYGALPSLKSLERIYNK